MIKNAPDTKPHPEGLLNCGVLRARIDVLFIANICRALIFTHIPSPHTPLSLSSPIAAVHEVQRADTGAHIEAAIAAVGSERYVQYTGLEKRNIRANTKQFGPN